MAEEQVYGCASEGGEKNYAGRCCHRFQTPKEQSGYLLLSSFTLKKSADPTDGITPFPDGFTDRSDDMNVIIYFSLLLFYEK